MITSECPPPPVDGKMTNTSTPASMATERAPTQFKDMEPSVTVPAQINPKAQEFSPGCGLAIFSTELCTRAKRELQGHLRPPVIVRSDGVKGVVDAARNWQARFKVQCLCIFPGQGWTVSDLWDAVDVQLDTPSFCQEMLTFISRDTYHAARRFATDWIRAYPDRLPVVASDMAELHTTNDPFSMVDKIYSEGERGAFPRTFLWHVAHMMRASVLEMRLANAAATSRDESPAGVQQRQRAKTMVQLATTDRTAFPEEAEASASAPRKKNRKITRPRPNKLTDETASVTPTAPAMIKSTSLPMPTIASEPQPVNQNAGNITDNVTGQTMTSPIIPSQALKVLKGPPRSNGSIAYTQSGSSHNWAENNYRPTSGQYPGRHTSGGMPQLASPQYVVPNLASGQHVGPAGYISPYAHGSPMIAANMVPMPHYNPAMGQPGLMLHPSGMAPNPQMGPVYVSQPHTVRGASIGDMTNSGYYAPGMAPHVVHQQGSSARRPSNYNTNGGVLYDPYNGTNSNFREPTTYIKGKKPHYNDAPYQANRPRNVSSSGSRPAHVTHKLERTNHQPYYGTTNSYRTRTRENSEDDPTITENRSTGCHEQWIGPENATVTELFVGDLPMDASPGEVSKMFEQQMHIIPVNVSIRVPKRYDGSMKSDRCHAFVALESIADAKKAISMRERNFRIRDDGSPVSISVPRRFFQLPNESLQRGSLSSGSYNFPAQTIDRDTHKTIREESKVVEPAGEGTTRVKATYSPQDARSGLHRKSDVRSNDVVPNEATQARKPKSSQVSPTKKQQAKRESTAPKTPSGKRAKAAGTIVEGSATAEPAASNDKSSQGQPGDRKDSVLPDTLGTSIVKTTATSPISVALESEASLSITENLTAQIKSGKATSGLSNGDATASVQLDMSPVVKIWSNPTTIANKGGQLTEPTSTKNDEPTRTVASTSPQLPERNGVKTDVAHEATSESVLPTPALAVSDQKSPKVSTAAQEEKTVVDSTPEITLTVEPVQAVAVKEPSQATGSTKVGEAAAIPATESGVGIDTEAKSTTISNADIPAKSGVAQVTSLHPYAKANKTQLKKAKEALRKQRQKEQAEKAEKAKAEKAKAERERAEKEKVEKEKAEEAKAEKESAKKAKAEKTKLSTKGKEAAVVEDSAPESICPREMPVLPDQTNERKSDDLATPEAGKTEGPRDRDSAPTAKANGVAVASDEAQKFDRASDAAVPLTLSVERIPTNIPMRILNEAEYRQLEVNGAVGMTTETSRAQPKVEESQDPPIASMPATESAKPDAPEAVTPTPKKRSKNKRKKTKKAAPPDEGNKQAEVVANGIKHNDDSESLIERVRRGFGYGGAS
ncbi:hypothetical protein NX059_008363 [Plenodomus lindquistii]|nr:hypothetical protein NX059_008363 [Plenodomus lindquistii]